MDRSDKLLRGIQPTYGPTVMSITFDVKVDRRFGKRSSLGTKLSLPASGSLTKSSESKLAFEAACIILGLPDAVRNQVMQTIPNRLHIAIGSLESGFGGIWLQSTDQRHIDYCAELKNHNGCLRHDQDGYPPEYCLLLLWIEYGYLALVVASG